MPTVKSLDDAAAATGIARRTLQRWLAAGAIRPYRVFGDRRRFVDLDEIRAVREPQLDERPSTRRLRRNPPTP